MGRFGSKISPLWLSATPSASFLPLYIGRFPPFVCGYGTLAGKVCSCSASPGRRSGRLGSIACAARLPMMGSGEASQECGALPLPRCYLLVNVVVLSTTGKRREYFFSTNFGKAIAMIYTIVYYCLAGTRRQRAARPTEYQAHQQNGRRTK